MALEVIRGGRGAPSVRALPAWPAAQSEAAKRSLGDIIGDARLPRGVARQAPIASLEELL
jgi:hypothetical protein